jgi:FkbM family methyltransferase
LYSQNCEERHILEALGGKVGALLDLGAYDGKTFSNSLALVERGWSGCLVEPSISAFGRLLELHGNNDKIQLVQALVGVKSGLMPFWNSEDAVSTTEARSFALWKAVGNFKPICYVPQITVKDLLSEFPAFGNSEFVNIDTEGTSAALFFNWPIELCAPKVFCVEHDKFQKDITALASSWGYSLAYENTENVVLVK